MSRFQRYVKRHGLAAVAEGCGVSVQAVHKWTRYGIPAERIVSIEKVTGIPREQLRPELYRRPMRRSIKRDCITAAAR